VMGATKQQVAGTSRKQRRPWAAVIFELIALLVVAFIVVRVLSPPDLLAGRASQGPQCPLDS